MTAKKKQPKSVKFPFEGSDDENLAAAKRMTRQGLKQADYSSKSVLPKALVHAVFKKAYPTRSKYFDAFIQEKAAEELDVLNLNDLRGQDNDDQSDPYESGGLMPRRVIFIDEYSSSYWDTKLARLKSGIADIDWVPLPEAKIEEIKRRKIPKSDWETWATEFLLFASKCSLLEASEKGRKGGIVKSVRSKTKGQNPS